MFPVTQLAAQCVLFSQCFGLSSSIRPGKPVLVDPMEKMLMPLQILWLHSFNGSEEFGWISLYEGMVIWLLLYWCIWHPSNSVTHPPSAHSHQQSQKTSVSCVSRFTIWIFLCQPLFITHFFLGLIKVLAYFCMLLFPVLCHLCCFLAFNTTEDMTSG